MVVTADCKGIVMRGQAYARRSAAANGPAGERVNGKRMAAVGAVYTVDPYVRTAADVVAALFRDPDYEAGAAGPNRATNGSGPACRRTLPKPRSGIAVVIRLAVVGVRAAPTVVDAADGVPVRWPRGPLASL